MLSAVLFDYDNTLADTLSNNLAVTFRVLGRLGPGYLDSVPWPLRSVREYGRANYLFANWREMYIKGFGLTEEETEAAGALWGPCQLSEGASPELFAGTPELIRSLRGVPLAICSQNSARVIRAKLAEYGLDGCFGAIVGHEDVPFDCQKPHPAGFLAALDALGASGGTLCYVGDHPEDMTFGKNAERALRRLGADVRVICAAARWCGAEAGAWPADTDFFAASPEALAEYLSELRRGS